MNPEIEQAYLAFVEADNAWNAEIERSFPLEWPGDVRYTPRAHGEPGSVLAERYAAYVKAREHFQSRRGP